MSKRARENSTHSEPPSHLQHGDGAQVDSSLEDGESAASSKKLRTFMATLACNACRARKSRCDEDRPKCGYCKNMNIECTYQTVRPTKKDQSMTVAINSLRRLETKVEDLTAAIYSRNFSQPSSSGVTALPISASPQIKSPVANFSQPSPGVQIRPAISPQTIETPGRTAYPEFEGSEAVKLSFSQHGVTLWPAVKQILSTRFNAARELLPREYVVHIETHRQPLPMHIAVPTGYSHGMWLSNLPLSAIEGLAHAYFAVFNRNTPVLDKYHFFSNTLGLAMENDFGYDIETCVVLMVLTLGCLAAIAHEEGDFALPSRAPSTVSRFEQPDWYDLVLDETPGLRFFNEARARIGFFMSQNDLQTGQFHMLSTLYYSQILRPIDSWTAVNRAALCCMSILAQTDSTESSSIDDWESDMFSRLYWNTLMYETIITQELSLPSSGLLEHELDMPIPKFTPSPRPKASIAGLLVDDDDDSFFNFHFLAQAAHRIILTRIRHNLYTFAERAGYPTTTITSEMHHQLEQWRTNLPPPLQFSNDKIEDAPPSPAHVIAKAMLRSRYLVAKFHIGRPFLYKALHAPAHTTESEYREIRKGLKGGMYWPTTMGLCVQMKSALPIKFGWSSQCFGQVLFYHAVARSPDPKLRETLPDGFQEWVQVMMGFIESCGRDSPAIAKDAELLRLL